jgi:hypothetical protein
LENHDVNALNQYEKAILFLRKNIEPLKIINLSK